MSHGAITDALSFCVATRTPVLLWGDPGTAKTSVTTQLAAASGRHIETVIASIREPSDFGGLPIVDNGGYKLAPADWAKRLKAAPNPVLFLDEISTAPPAVQAALLRVVLDRVVGGLELPATVSIIAAANPPDQAAGGWELAAPLANRFTHLDWKLDVGVWTDGLTAGVWDAPRVPTLPDNWEAVHGPAERASVAAFVRKRPHLMLKVPEDEAQQGRAWPSPRTWTMAARLLSACMSAHARAEVQQLLVVGCVGEGPALEFFGWRRDLDLPDPEELLADPEGAPLPLDRGDRAYVILAGVAHAATREESLDRWNRAWKVLARAAREGTADIAANAARTLARNIPKDASAPPEAATFAPVLRAAGLLRSR